MAEVDAVVDDGHDHDRARRCRSGAPGGHRCRRSQRRSRTGRPDERLAGVVQAPQVAEVRLGRWVGGEVALLVGGHGDDSRVVGERAPDGGRRPARSGDDLGQAVRAGRGPREAVLARDVSALGGRRVPGDSGRGSRPRGERVGHRRLLGAAGATDRDRRARSRSRRPSTPSRGAGAGAGSASWPYRRRLVPGIRDSLDVTGGS